MTEVVDKDTLNIFCRRSNLVCVGSGGVRFGPGKKGFEVFAKPTPIAGDENVSSPALREGSSRVRVAQ